RHAGKRIGALARRLEPAGDIAEGEKIVGGKIAAEERRRAGAGGEGEQQLGARKIEINAPAGSEREVAQIALRAGEADEPAPGVADIESQMESPAPALAADRERRARDEGPGEKLRVARAERTRRFGGAKRTGAHIG